MKRFLALALLFSFLLGGILLGALGVTSGPPDRDKAEKLMKEGNFKEAYDIFRELALDPQDDPKKVDGDLDHAIQCLRRINRVPEVDALREEVIGVHAKNWRLLRMAARSYLHDDHHYGYMIAGEFERGQHRGGGKVVSSYLRDRSRALQLCRQALPLAAADEDRRAVGSFYLEFAQALMGASGFQEAWRLQSLTDLDTLPDFEEGWRYGPQYSDRGAPVDEEGHPIFHKLPESWEAARSDGERWRWMLLQAEEKDSSLSSRVRRHFADFLHQQFGVQTMASYRNFFGRGAEVDEAKKDESGTWELHTLGENETIAKLATGIKRFELPDEYNFLKLYKGLECWEQLAEIHTNRRQYEKGAAYWIKVLQRDGKWEALKNQPYTHRSKARGWSQLCQIRGNLGSFEPVSSQPAGKGATVEFRFRNGNKVHFEAHAINVPKLLDDVKAYVKTRPARLDWNKMNISNIGWQIANKKWQKYVGAKVADWDLDLEPRPGHFDRRITVTTPLQRAGAYLLRARMEGGNENLIVLWVADTVLVKKPIDNGSFYFVADASSGQPVPRANVEFFGYRQRWVRQSRGQGHYEIDVRQYAEFSDADGMLVLDKKQQPSGFQWVISATTPAGRLAWLGFTNAWYRRHQDAEYNATKTYVITDRPVYRPEQKVQFKVWVNKAQYDREGPSPFAGQKISIEVRDPRNEKVFSKVYKADEYGGIDGEFPLAEEATLGVYRIQAVNLGGGGTFRVEEYKKPEFEVRIEAPSEPVMLGEKITAKVVSKYYFGAPVTEGKVKYKVTRTEHSARWYPTRRWDWFYGPGYWWFAPDYLWWPGWSEWGCRRPSPWWYWQWRGRQAPPEVVAEGETTLGEDGTISIEIDTSVAKAIHPDRDHRYEITAEVTDRSRRTIVGKGQVLVARKPFKVYVWVDRGWYRAGDDIRAAFNARTLDGKPVAGAKAKVRLLQVSYEKGMPVEREVESWELKTDAEGRGGLQLKAAEAGQYRLRVSVDDGKEHVVDGGYVLVVRGEGFDGGEFRFNDLELVPDKGEVAPGEQVKLMVNVNRRDAPVLLFLRPTNGVCLKPKLLRIAGKSAVEVIDIVKRDMPNFFVEALTVAGGKVHSEMREIIVPPESRVLDIAIEPSAKEYLPGAPGKFTVKVTDSTGEPYRGSLVVSLYDKAVEYISGGSNVVKIKEFFWKWRRHHNMNTEHSLNKASSPLAPQGSHLGMGYLGVFGATVANELRDKGRAVGADSGLQGGELLRSRRGGRSAPPAAASRGAVADYKLESRDAEEELSEEGGSGAAEEVEPVVRTQFADTAFWSGSLETDAEGKATIALTMPENLTTWKARVWGMGGGARCGEATVDVITRKNLILRLQAPRFFVQKDEVVLSANVHNYLSTAKDVRVVLELDGGTLEPMSGDTAQSVAIDAGSEARIDWRVRVLKPGEATVRMKALTDEESDAMQMSFPVLVHGMLKTESFCGVIRPDEERARVAIRVPAERRPRETRLEIRYSPTLAMAMIDALPYLVEYPYGCTEQTLNRFLPTVITQKVLQRMGVDLEEVQKKITNLNAQEIGEDIKRSADWQRLAGKKRWDGEKWVERNPVYDEALVRDMVKAGVEKLTSMQNSDGGWGWFSGWGERSYPHTTAVVVHGLQVARENDVAIVPGVLERGVAWLKRYQEQQVELLLNAAEKDHEKRWKRNADNLDALVYMILVDAGNDGEQMRRFLYRDRNKLAVYAKAMFGLALHKAGHVEERDMLLRNVEQLLVKDDENQTAWLELGNGSYWWYWYGSEYEAQAYYLKLLVATDPRSETAPRLVKYLLNNRRHATYWHSTRDTAVVIEAFADYLKATGEDRPDMTVTIAVDGEVQKQVHIAAENLFSYDNKLVLEGLALSDGEHVVALRKEGTGPLYWNAYLTNFTLEDPIARAGLEVKVERRIFKLVPVEKTIKDEGSRGQVVDRKVEKYERQLLEDGALLKSGDLVEIELVVESKNDYEYIVLEDMKAAGFEPVQVRSGYGGNAMGAYMELRDERVSFFVRKLARGKHSLSYRMRAEIPGRFSALPARASAMYAPELKANSDEQKLRIED